MEENLDEIKIPIVNEQEKEGGPVLPNQLHKDCLHDEKQYWHSDYISQ